MSRPTMERAIEAIEPASRRGRSELCEEMKHESQFMHDLLVDGIAGLISFVKERLGDEGVEEAWAWSLERSWRRPVETIAESDRREVAEGAGGDLARPLDQRGRPEPGAFEIAEDDEKLTFTMNPCGSGQRLWRHGPIRRGRLGGDRRGPRLELRARGLPPLLHPLRVHERGAADPLDRVPGVPVRPAGRLRPRSLHLVLVQGPGRHPGRHFDRYGRGAVGWAAEGRRPTRCRDALGEALGADPGDRSSSARSRAAPRARPAWSTARPAGGSSAATRPAAESLRPAGGGVRGGSGVAGRRRRRSRGRWRSSRRAGASGRPAI